MIFTRTRNTPVNTDRIVAGFLANETDAIALVAGWARDVARYRAWGFEEPEDLVQEVLLAVVRNLRDERFVAGDLRAYVRRIAKNVCISSYRRARTRGVEAPLDEGLQATGGDGRSLERRAMLTRILASLDDACRRMIAQAYYYGLSRKEIAARWGISVTAAKVRLFRCLEKARMLQNSTAGHGEGS